MDVPVIFEDETLLVLDKPPGLVADESATYHGETLEALMKKRGISLERGGIVHRLDKDTSGLVIVAKTQNALENLQSQFASRTVKKMYTVLVHGFVEEAGIVEGAIGRHPVNREKFAVLEGGKEAETEYSTLGNFQFSVLNFQSIFNDLNKIQQRKIEKMHYNEFSLLDCFPKTGRTHQIRVHLKYIGHPVVSDEKYGGRKIVRMDKRWCPRQFLHAERIEFKHPATGESLVFESPLPKDLEKSLGLLEPVSRAKR